MHYYYSHTIITENRPKYAALYIQACLKIQHCPFKAKINILFSKTSRNVHVLCSCKQQSLPHCWLQIIYNSANNSLTSKRYEQNVHMLLYAVLDLISKQAHLLTTTALNTVRFKVNVYGNVVFAYRPTASPIGYAVRAESCAIES